MAMVDRMKPDLLEGSDLQAYDELVAESDEGTLFQTSWWHRITDAAYGGAITTEQYGYFENGRLVAAIPISTYRKFGRPFVFNSKLTPYSGPIFFNKPDAKIVTKNSRQKSVNGEFAKLIKDKGTCIGYPFGPAHTDLQPYLWNGFSIGVNYHYVLDIDDLTTIESNFDKPKRAELRQAQKYGLEVKFGDIHDFIRLNNETMKRQNHPLFPPELWETVYRESRARGCGEVFTAYDDTGPVGSLLLVWDNKRSYHLGSGISATSRVANTLLTWEVIQFSKQRLDLGQYDFLGSSVPSIESFMRQFGGTLHPLFYIYERSLKRDLVMAVRSRLAPSS